MDEVDELQILLFSALCHGQWWWHCDPDIESVHVNFSGFKTGVSSWHRPYDEDQQIILAVSIIYLNALRYFIGE